MEAYIFIVTITGLPLILSWLVTNDVIIRHVCRREGRRYSFLWLWSWYWHWRIFKPGWFAQARSAGYLPLYTTLTVVWMCYILVAFYFLPSRKLI